MAFEPSERMNLSAPNASPTSYESRLISSAVNVCLVLTYTHASMPMSLASLVFLARDRCPEPALVLPHDPVLVLGERGAAVLLDVRPHRLFVALGVGLRR